ncbi:MAG: pyridoxine 5'-phosphate synthase [Alphaproteobacteria bacterium]
MTSKPLRLGVNVDHVATLRNARGGVFPCPIVAAHLAVASGADGITVHLREDRRHIRDEDVRRLRQELSVPLNLEMAATAEMQKFAQEIRPHACCIVPERREERTTEGGLDIWGHEAHLKSYIEYLTSWGIRVSLFCPPEKKHIDAAKRTGAPVIELYTGHYSHGREGELARIQEAAKYAASLDLEVHGGHGLTYDNVTAIAVIPEIVELNIGHFLMGEALFVGLAAAIKKMRERMDAARAEATL